MHWKRLHGIKLRMKINFFFFLLNHLWAVIFQVGKKHWDVIQMNKKIEMFERNLKKLGFKGFEEHQIDEQGNKCFIGCNDKATVMCAFKLPSGEQFQDIEIYETQDMNKRNWELLTNTKEVSTTEWATSYKKNITTFYNILRGVEVVLKAQEMHFPKIELINGEDKTFLKSKFERFWGDDDINTDILLDLPFTPEGDSQGTVRINVSFLKGILNNHSWIEDITLKFMNKEHPLFIHVHGHNIVAEFLVAPLYHPAGE